MATVADLTFKVPTALAGKSFKEIGSPIPQDWYGVPFGREGFETAYETPLTAGQLLNFQTHDPTYQGSGQYQGLVKLLGAPLNQAQVQDVQAQKALAARQQAIAPAVQSLEVSIPEIAQKFGTERSRLQGEVDPLKQRYQTLIDDLTRRESRDVGEVNKALSSEFSRRGIPLSSGLYEQTGLERRQPVSEFYGIQQREAVGERESGLRQLQNLIAGLTPQETEANRTIRNAIAQLQAGAGTDAITDAQTALRFMEEQRQFNQNLALQKTSQDLQSRQLDIQRELGLAKQPSSESASEKALREAQAAYYLAQAGKLGGGITASGSSVSGGGGFTGGAGGGGESKPTGRPTFGSTFLPQVTQLQTQFGGGLTGPTAIRGAGLNVPLLQTLGYK